MNRKVLLLNLALLALAATLGWQLRVRWLDARTHERTFLSRTPAGPPVLPPPPAQLPKPVSPADYIDVAQKTLFSKDRNPNVIVDPPPPAPAPPKPAPPKEPGLGVDMGGGFRACVPGDPSPAGTVLNGYRKVVAQSLMGPSCHWEQVK